MVDRREGELRGVSLVYTPRFAPLAINQSIYFSILQSTITVLTILHRHNNLKV